ncbi:MAG: hypothetical protein AAF960_19440 [Bacteroidota bacterium]
MNLTKAKILLDKINRLYKSMSLDEENVANIEKDLMRDYIKQLYDTFLVENGEPKVTTRPKVSFTPPPVVPKREEIPTPTARKAPPPPKVEVPPKMPPPVVNPKPTFSPPPVVKAKPTYTPPPLPPIVEAKPTYSPPPSTKPTYTPPKPKPTVVNRVDPEHSELFELNTEARELSEKLGQTRIKDLNNAMGLNERIFTINELFGADNSLYRNVIRDLNNMSSFEEATAYLSANVAEKFNWTHKNKRNKAKNFIKLVRRRYL